MFIRIADKLSLIQLPSISGFRRAYSGGGGGGLYPKGLKQDKKVFHSSADQNAFCINSIAF